MSQPVTCPKCDHLVIQHVNNAGLCLVAGCDCKGLPTYHIAPTSLPKKDGGDPGAA